MFLSLDCDYVFGGVISRAEVLFSSHHIKGNAINMSYTVDTDCDSLADVVFVRFLDFKVTLLFPLVPGKYCALWKK